MFSYNQKQIIIHLLNGCLIKKVPSMNVKYSHRLYECMNPILKVSSKDFLKLYYFLKEDKQKRLTINLNKVRQERGNSWIKTTYKKSKQNLTITIKKKQHATGNNINHQQKQTHPSLF